MMLENLGFDNGDTMISLRKLTGKVIANIALAPMMIPGVGPVLAITRVDFTDGTHLNAHGDRDVPYLQPGSGLSQPGFDQETVTALYDEWYADE